MRRHLWKLLAIAGPMVVIAAFGFGLTRDPSNIQSATTGKPAPAFELASLEDGTPIRFADYRGHVVVVNFWASWCVSCRAEHDVLVELGNRLKGRKDVALLGVNYRDTEDAAKSFLERYGTYPYESAVDPRGRTGIDFGVYGLPETYFVDSRGIIRARHIGPIDRDTAYAILNDLGIEP